MSKQTKHIYQFGPFRLDTAERLLLRDGRPVPLEPKAFETLVALVAQSGRLVGKDELLQRIWPDSFVEEVNLARNISRLRKVLAEGFADQPAIETVPKHGYRFLPGVTEVWDELTELVIEKTATANLLIEQEETITKDEAGATGAQPRRVGWTNQPRWLALSVLLLGAAMGLALLRARHRPPEAAAPIKSLAGTGARPGI